MQLHGRKRAFVGWALITLGAVCFIALSALRSAPFGGWLQLVVVVVSACGLLYCGVWLCATGYRLRSQEAGDVLLRDKRPPVFYLRFFGIDGLRPPSNDDDFSLRFLKYVFPNTIESWVSRSLKRVGPVVGLYPPGASQVGPYISPVFVDDEHWQNRFLELLRSAQLLFVVNPIGTPGFSWELSTVYKRCLPTRIAVLYCLSISDLADIVADEEVMRKMVDLPGPFADLLQLLLNEWPYPYKKRRWFGGVRETFSMTRLLADFLNDGELPVLITFDESWNPRMHSAPRTISEWWLAGRLNPVSAGVSLALSKMKDIAFTTSNATTGSVQADDKEHSGGLEQRLSPALTLHMRGELLGARQRLEALLLSCQRVLGEAHTITSKTAWCLVRVLEDSGEYNAARAVIDRELIWLLHCAPSALSKDQREIRHHIAEAARAIRTAGAADKRWLN